MSKHQLMLYLLGFQSLCNLHVLNRGVNMFQAKAITYHKFPVKSKAAENKISLVTPLGTNIKRYIFPSVWRQKYLFSKYLLFSIALGRPVTTNISDPIMSLIPIYVTWSVRSFVLHFLLTLLSLLYSVWTFVLSIILLTLPLELLKCAFLVRAKCRVWHNWHL